MIKYNNYRTLGQIFKNSLGFPLLQTARVQAGLQVLRGDVLDVLGGTGFPKKDARFSKLTSILDLLSYDREGKMIETIAFNYFSSRASFTGNPVLQSRILTYA